MIDLRLTRAELEAYERGLAKSSHLKIRATILNGNEEEVASVTADQELVADGAVDVDTTAAVVRQARLTLVDARGTLDFDPDSPADEALWVDRFLAIERLDWIDELGGYVDAPVFWGPLAHYERTGEVVEVEALGKEALGLAPNVLWKSLTFPKGARETYLIRRLLKEQGEQRLTIPDGIDRRLPKRRSFGKMAEPWLGVEKACRNLDRHGFYDGRGYLRLRRFPDTPSFAFLLTPGKGEPAFLTGDPTWSYDPERVRNVVEVLGKDPKGKAPRVRAVAKADAEHPLSAQSLARNGQPRWMVERIENNMGQQAAEALADRRLRQLLRTDLEVAAESLVVPHLEELDVVVVQAAGRRVEVPLKVFTIPLTADSMSLGFTKRQRYRSRKRKGKRGR